LDIYRKLFKGIWEGFFERGWGGGESGSSGALDIVVQWTNIYEERSGENLPMRKKGGTGRDDIYADSPNQEDLEWKYSRFL